MKTKKIKEGDLHFIGRIPLEQIESLTFHIEKNNHAFLNLTGLLDPEEGKEVMEESWEGQVFSLLEKGEGGQTFTLFTGYVSKVEIEQEGGQLKAKVEGVSSSILLDLHRRSRSFQNTELTYQEMMGMVAGQTDGMAILFQMEDKKIDYPVIQYEETDWEFLCRMASQCHGALYPEVSSLKPWIYCGLPRGEEKEDFSILSSKKGFDPAYYEYIREGEEALFWKQRDFFYWEIKTWEPCFLGDTLPFLGGQYVQRIHASLERGFLEYTCQFGSKAYGGMGKRFHPTLAGHSINGTVIGVRDEKVQLHLDIDEDQDSQEAYWYDWIPQTGNLFYCMPELGTRAALYIENKKGEGRAVHSIRTNGELCKEAEKKTHRTFTTKDRKRMYLLPDAFGFSNEKEERVEIKGEDKKGISLDSCGELIIQGEKEVTIRGSQIGIHGPKEITMARRDRRDPTVLNMSNGFDAVGTKAGIVTTKKGLPSFPTEKKGEKRIFSLAGEETFLYASTPMRKGDMPFFFQKAVLGTKVYEAGLSPNMLQTLGQCKEEWKHVKDSKDRRDREEPYPYKIKPYELKRGSGLENKLLKGDPILSKGREILSKEEKTGETDRYISNTLSKNIRKENQWNQSTFLPQRKKDAAKKL